VVQVLQVVLQVIQALSLRPVIRVIVQVTEIPAISFLPVCELRFHQIHRNKFQTEARAANFGERLSSGAPDHGLSASSNAKTGVACTKLLDHIDRILIMLHTQDLSVPKVSWPGNIHDPRFCPTALLTQVILSWPARAHNYYIAPCQLNIKRVRIANNLRDARVVWLKVDLIRQRRAKTRICNLAPLLGGAPVSDWP
jgi:hypothetical protein